jgi:hypothetical protein
MKCRDDEPSRSCDFRTLNGMENAGSNGSDSNKSALLDSDTRVTSPIWIRPRWAPLGFRCPSGLHDPTRHPLSGRRRSPLSHGFRTVAGRSLMEIRFRRPRRRHCLIRTRVQITFDASPVVRDTCMHTCAR